MTIPELDAFLAELPAHLPALEVILHGGRAAGKDTGDIDVVVIGVAGEADADRRAHDARKAVGLSRSTLDVVGIALDELVPALRQGDTLLRTTLRRGRCYPGGRPSSFVACESSWCRKAAVRRALRVAMEKAAVVRDHNSALTAGERAWDYVVHAAALACGIDVEWKWNGNGAQSLSALAANGSESPMVLAFLTKATIVRTHLPGLVEKSARLEWAIADLATLVAALP